jgi:C-terminal processing protease CtpA/Prc
MSTTAEFTAAAHYNKLATFIGEESGGSYCGGNGGDFALLPLKHTQITVHIPLAKYVMAIPNQYCSGNGTIPDYEIRQTVEDALELRDPQLEQALKLINAKGH